LLVRILRVLRIFRIENRQLEALKKVGFGFWVITGEFLEES
jgi:hypothetical protein